MNARQDQGGHGPEEETVDHPRDHTQDWDDPDFDEDSLGEEMPELADALRAALGTGSDVRDRARHRVDRHLQSVSPTSTLSMLAGTAVETMRHLLTNQPFDADRSTEEVDP